MYQFCKTKSAKYPIFRLLVQSTGYQPVLPFTANNFIYSVLNFIIFAYPKYQFPKPQRGEIH
jgi:hypothetical protein